MPQHFETWVRRVVAFDTNAYRALAFNADPEVARDRARSLVSAERAHGIQALACPTVLWELIAHLATPEDPDYEAAKAALVAAVEHTSVPINPGRHPAIWASADLQLCRSLWGVAPDQLLGTDDLIRAIAARVAEDASEPALARIRDDLSTASRTLADAERVFAASMQRHLMPHWEAEARARGSTATRKQLLDALVDYLGTDRAREAVAMAHVLRAMSYAEITASEEEIHAMARWVSERFAVAITLYIDVVRKIAQSNWDPKTGKGPNSLWDLQLAFLIGPDHTIDGRAATIVTADTDITQAAKSLGLAAMVPSYTTYRSSLRQSATG